MKRLRYRIFDPEQGKFLKRATQIGGDPRVLLTEWTHHRERAQWFPGAASARSMRDKLGGALLIYNDRGVALSD